MVDLPIKNGDFPVCKLLIYQRLYPIIISLSTIVKPLQQTIKKSPDSLPDHY